MMFKMKVWWMVTAAVVVVGCHKEPALLRQVNKERLIQAIQQALLQSVVAEKSAVLATSDEESQALALEAQHSTTDINRLRDELRPRIVADAHPEEIDALNKFDAAWTEFEDVDHRLLALAVANTNLKAARLSARDGAAALDRFVDAVSDMQRGAADPETIRTLSQASVAALRVQSALLIHIPSADEAEMTRLEQHMRELSDEVDRSLVRTRETNQLAAEPLAKAAAAWSEYRGVTVDVLRLSRQNSNVISFDVSVHEKRQATKQCLAALSALLAAVESAPQATR